MAEVLKRAERAERLWAPRGNRVVDEGWAEDSNTVREQVDEAD